MLQRSQKSGSPGLAVQAEPLGKAYLPALDPCDHPDLGDNGIRCWDLRGDKNLRTPHRFDNVHPGGTMSWVPTWSKLPGR